MLNPQTTEYLIDPAAGSASFTVHSIFHVWKDIFEDEGLEPNHLFTLRQTTFLKFHLLYRQQKFLARY